MRVSVILTGLMVAALVAGCNAREATFVLSNDTNDLIREVQRPIEKALLENFGTPHKLVAWEKLPVEYGKADLNHTTPGWQLLSGRNLYMRHCLHCHGVSGDGNGPTAQYLNPRPRDYRRGIFKFTSTANQTKARRDDLLLVLKNGIPGTSMPSFVLLKAEELTAIVEYVRWLAMRGEFERKLTAEYAEDFAIKSVTDQINAGGKRSSIVEEFNKKLVAESGQLSEFATTVNERADDIANDWLAAEDEANLVVPTHNRIDPLKDKESVSRGRSLFMSAALKCTQCHGYGGKGDGSQTTEYIVVGNKIHAERGLHDDWGNLIMPRNLTLGQFRGGRRPIDIYRRIHSGIKGTPMGAFVTSLRKQVDETGKKLTDEQSAELLDRDIWDIVNYVLDVPHQKQTLEPLLPKAIQATAATK